MSTLDKAKAIRENEDGFTLIEILVVLVIIGILAAIATPIVLANINSGKETATERSVSVADIALTQYFNRNGGNYPDAGDAEGATVSEALSMDPQGGGSNAADGLGQSAQETYGYKADDDVTVTIVKMEDRNAGFCLLGEHKDNGIARYQIDTRPGAVDAENVGGVKKLTDDEEACA